MRGRYADARLKLQLANVTVLTAACINPLTATDTLR
jgi:hypothetical protein